MSVTEEKVTKKELVFQELEEVRGNNIHGILKAEDVVEYARSHTGSALHSKFSWDDEEAAQQWRLNVARGIIRSYVAIISEARPERFRAYVSLTTDRSHKGGGYRVAATVLNDAEMRKQLKADANLAMKRFMTKFNAVEELTEVFAAMEKAMVKLAS